MSPRLGYVARGTSGYYEILEKGWFYAFIPDSPSQDETIQWRPAKSLDEAKQQCERLRLEVSGPRRIIRPPTPPGPVPAVPIRG